MFNRLQQKWKVGGWQLALILCTFALGGSLCGFLTRQIITPLNVENAWLYGTLYFVILTVLWPFCVLLISLPFGQFRFFRNYLRKMGQKLGIGKNPVETAAPNDQVQIAIFASGTGTNARKIMEHFANHPTLKVSLLVSNKPGAGALHHAADFGVNTLIIERQRFLKEDGYVPELAAAGIDFIVLAGFLWKVPPALVKAFPQHIINIHPALLPKYGGKGMYGHHVHEAVIAAGDKESGITIHWVDEQYDNGAIIFQATCPVLPSDTADSLATRIHGLEHEHFAKVIANVIAENR